MNFGSYQWDNNKNQWFEPKVIRIPAQFGAVTPQTILFPCAATFNSRHVYSYCSINKQLLMENRSKILWKLSKNRSNCGRFSQNFGRKTNYPNKYCNKRQIPIITPNDVIFYIRIWIKSTLFRLFIYLSHREWHRHTYTTHSHAHSLRSFRLSIELSFYKLLQIFQTGGWSTFSRRIFRFFFLRFFTCTQSES